MQPVASLLGDIADTLSESFRRGPYRLYCHTSVYYAIQRISDIQPQYPPHPLDRLYGADVIVAPELGNGVWELYEDNKLVGWGRLSEQTPDGRIRERD